MLQSVLLLSTICGLARSSGIGDAHLAPAPIVTASSSQYFQRTFNRLVVPQAVAVPVAPPPLAPVIPVAPPTPVFVEPTRAIPVAFNPPPPQEVPVQPNVAIAIATAHTAAPVATILLPPYPFGFPPTFGLVPSEQPINVPDENTKEPTTQRTMETEATTTPEPESTTPIDASSSDNSFVQAFPSNENVNNIYGPPVQQQPGSQFQPQQPNNQFQPQQFNPQLRPQQPNPQFRPQQPNPQFRPNPQFQPQQPQRPNPQFQPQQPNPQFRPQQPNPQFRPNPQFQPQQPQRPNPQFQPQRPNPEFQPQQPEFPPYPPKQQPRPQLQPQAKPQPRPQFQGWPQQKGRPQKLKTSVEVVPVPLVYITPPPLHKTHAHVKVVKHIYTYVPASSDKIILKPIKIRPVKLVKHKIVRSQNLRANARDIEVTTFNPFPRPNTKPPRA